MWQKIVEAYSYIINHESFVVCMDCDSTVITSSFDSDWQIITTWEWLSDVAIALGRRIGKLDLYKEVDAIAQIAMSQTWSVFADSLDARLKILIEHWLKREDVEKWARKAVLAEWFWDYIKVMTHLENHFPLECNRFFFLSGWFYEMLIHAIAKTMDEKSAEARIFSNYFLYEWESVIGWDTQKSKMFVEEAKKIQVDELRKSWNIPKHIKVSWLWDGSNDISMSNAWLFVAYTWTKRREQVVRKAWWVEAENFYEALIFHTSPDDRAFLMNDINSELCKILMKWKLMLEKRVKGITIL